MTDRIEDHRKVEAVLFAVGRDIGVEELSQLCKIPESRIPSLLDDLQEEFNNDFNSSLMLINKGDFWKFTVKDQYLPLVSDIVEKTELDKSTMETLAVIAWKYPILQSEVVKIRHNKAYNHIKLLEEQGFITRQRSGRTYKIRLTDKFFEYFDLPSDAAKEAFRDVIPEEVQEEIEEAEREIEEKEKQLEEHEAKKEEDKAQQKLSEEKSPEEIAEEAAEDLEQDAGDEEMNLSDEEESVQEENEDT